jgi:hypothetical protein
MAEGWKTRTHFPADAAIFFLSTMSRAYPMRQTAEILSIALLQTKISISDL